ncbi:hypothetical protein ACBI99_44775 [Nonomuraea sp. ATR24]|uniref:hypothetical protein n=1 Tax=Nonomuraea sp. ATR24 TaxID=1676744 RepID=UPI0035BF2308
MDTVTTIDVPDYQGPATLRCSAEGNDYDVSVSIVHWRELSYLDHCLDETPSVMHCWRADVEGGVPWPPYGECVLSLPGGGQGRGVLGNVAWTSEQPKTWRAKLTGAGPCPIAG